MWKYTSFGNHGCCPIRFDLKALLRYWLSPGSAALNKSAPFLFVSFVERSCHKL